MKPYFPTIATLAMSLMGSVLVPTLMASEQDKKTIITINQSIDVQGTVLDPGSYVMKLLDPNQGRNIVQIFSAEGNRLIATILANKAYRINPTDHSQWKFYDAAPGQPAALRTWFYPGDNFGFEFNAPRENVVAKSAPGSTGNAATPLAVGN
jgi:hypothetical protein